MGTPRIAALAAAAAFAAVIVAIEASSPKFFQAATQADFLKGDVENLSIDARGQLVLGPATDLVFETPSPFLWTLIPAPNDVVFAGTGNDGRVYRIDAQGKGSAFFDAAELEVHALALAPAGGLYVGSSPDGKIYRVDPNGAATTFFDPEEKYIWALATDVRGNLFAGTGEAGIVYRIGPDGVGTRFYDTKASHATALAVDKAGNLLVGTGSPGRVLRIDSTGRAFLLLDSPFQEIRALRFDDSGTLYVAGVNGRPGADRAMSPSVPAPPADRPTSDPTRPPVPSVSVSTEITAVAVIDASGGGGAGARDDRGALRGAVYRIAPDGLWDQLWESREDSPYDLTFDATGRLVIATGSKGKIYRLEGDPLRPTLLTRAHAQQVTGLHRDAQGRLYYVTSNPGKFFRLSPGRASRGTYESETRDAQVVSTWGAISWRGVVPEGSRVEISTRSGNTETPDETWSPWSAVYTSREGSPITSPKARYLQWRVVLAGAGEGPALTSVTAAYLQRNLRPQVRSITVHPPGIVFQKPFSSGDPDLAGFDNQTTPDRKLTQAAMTPLQPSGTPSLGRRTYQKGLQTLIWRADDENGDELAYEIRYRREGEPGWKVLRRDLSDPILVWDTTTVPNGTYVAAIVASDAPSNASGTALTGELESVAFNIDNSAPAILVRNVRTEGARTLVAFEVRDDHSPIQRVECSEDGQQWRTAFPRDGIADSKTEQYEVALDRAIGPRGLTLRATDAMNNVSTAQVDAPRR